MAMCEESGTCCPINFKWHLEGETFGKLTVEYLKYILFLRGQIPCLYDKVRDILLTNDATKQDKNLPTTCFNKQRRKKRIQDSLAMFDLLFKHIVTAVTELPVVEVVFTMGATLISPKELYLLTFPSRSTCAKCKETIISNQRSCIETFFRAIATAGIICSKDIPLLMKISVLLKIPNGCHINQYMNIRNYKIPKRGKKTVIQLNHKCCEHSFAPHCNIPTDKTNVSESQLSKSLEKQMESINLESVEKENPYCWIQLLPVVKGFKDTVTPNSPYDNIFI